MTARRPLRSGCPAASRCWVSTPTTREGVRSSALSRAASPWCPPTVPTLGSDSLRRSRWPAAGSWATYPAAVAQRLGANFGVTRGVTLALECDLPEASGMSSSSAVICASFLALARRNGLPASPKFRQLLPRAEELCHYLGCLENGQDCGPELPGDAGVGTFGGSEDHTAIMLGLGLG